MMDIPALRLHLETSITKLRGNWFSGRKSYEKIFATAIGGRVEKDKHKRRYWDCVWNDWCIELKKGNTWLDLVRYSEVLLKTTPASRQDVVTLFLVGKNDAVTDIYGVFTEALIHGLKLTRKVASDLLLIREVVVGRQLEALTKLQPKQIRKLASFHIDGALSGETG